MQTYNVKIESDISKSFFATRAANSVDLNTAKKSIHELSVQADLETPYQIGLIIGSSGSGKTTLAKQIFGAEVFKNYLDPSKAVIDQFPEQYSYDERAEMLMSIGLTSIPCWIKPAYTLSNGQRFRAEAVLAMVHSSNIVIDEWTSVVDRTVAKIMSHCIQKFARRHNKKITLISCHYDVIEWLLPDWIIDCNKQSYEDRRLLRRQREEQLKFDIREVGPGSWKYFSKYHYLSDELAPGKKHLFGLFKGDDQVGFLAFNNYVPKRKNHKNFIMHSNRLVIHPDYCGFGLGIKFVNECARYLKKFYKYDIRAKFSSVSMYRARIKDPLWVLERSDTQIGIVKNVGSSIGRGASNTNGGFRVNVKTWTFKFIG